MPGIQWSAVSGLAPCHGLTHGFWTPWKLEDGWADKDGVLLLDLQPAIQLTGRVKATFLIPDELYREVKAETAREGRTLREVTIGLFEQ